MAQECIDGFSTSDPLLSISSFNTVIVTLRVRTLHLHGAIDIREMAFSPIKAA